MKYITNAERYFDTFIHFIKSPLCPQTEKTIYIGLTNSIQTNDILFNTEQLSLNHHLTHIVNLKSRFPSLEIWDYSLVNIYELERKGVTAKYVPLITSGEYLEKIINFRKQPVIYDIGFNGSMSQRRRFIVDSLKEAGFSVLVSTSWGDARDLELSQCRALINIHFETTYRVFESARCEPWLSAGVPVISELSLDNDPRCILTTYERFVDAVKQYFLKIESK
jgi:hypothetical protein